MILIFDTYTGLCNQFYDIKNSINFCLKYNINFTFRYCSFRNDNLCSWFDQPFDKLFDTTFLNEYKLYIDYHSIKNNLTNDNCFNLNDKLLSHQFLNKDNLYDQLINFNKEYIILKHFWSLYTTTDPIDPFIDYKILPSKHILEKYNEIKNLIIKGQSYNFIHYRYEIDFTTHFKCKIENLDSLLERLEFKNNKLNIYIATTNIKKLLDLKDNKYTNILFKNDDDLLDLNFEEKAFIDYLFGLNSVESYGHSNSSFSVIINNIKKCNNFYN
jgi:hypothetical protein